MVGSYRPVKSFSNYQIYLREPGFEILPNTLGKVASFIAKGDNGVTAVFAFAYSMLDALQGTIKVNEADLLNTAIKVIEDAISSNSVQNDQEYTYQYQNGNFATVDNPPWWVKTTF